MTMNPSSAVGGLPCSLLGVFSQVDSIAEKCLPMKPGITYGKAAHTVIATKAAHMEQESFWSIVDDFHWVLNQLCGNAIKGQKRS